MTAAVTPQVEAMRVPGDADRDPASARWTIGAFAVVTASGALVGVRRAESPYADADIFWGARAGRDFLSKGVIPHADPYSWTAQGERWTPNSWGWNVILGTFDRIGGLAAIAVLGVAMTALIGLAAGFAARRIQARPAWTALLVQVTAGFFALFMYPRAQLVDYVAVLALPTLTAAALGAAGKRFAWLAMAIVAAQVLWMNLHTVGVLGPLIVAAAGAGHVLRGPLRIQLVKRTALLALMTGLACLATPYGWAPIANIRAARRASVGLIAEWQPIGFGSANQILGVVALVVAGVACALAWRRRGYDIVAVLVLLGAVTATAIRFAPMAALVAAPELALAAGAIKARPVFVKRVCACALAVLAVLSLVGLKNFARTGSSIASPRLIAALPHGCKLLNDYDIGGEVILDRPDVLVSIDSRNDLYGRAAELRSIEQLVKPSLGLTFVRSQKISCVLAPTAAPLVIALREQADWHIAAVDGSRTLLIRTPQP